MRIRVRLDVRRPLKRRKKIMKKNGEELMVSCKYERLGEFCLLVGCLLTRNDTAGSILAAQMQKLVRSGVVGFEPP